MRREIDDQQDTARPQRAHRLGNNSSRSVGEMQDLVDYRHVKSGVGQGCSVHISLTHLAVAVAAMVEVRARHQQHVPGYIV